jgi:hypothetical protein
VSERQTGATGVTDEQIAEAAQQFPLWKVAHKWDKKELEYQLRRWLVYLVPPSKVITDAARVLTDDELAAMRWFAENDGGDADEQFFEDLDRHTTALRAYLERQR